MSHLGLSKTQSLLNNVLPRIGGTASFLCAIYMVVTILQSKFYRGRIFHRIMLGCAINTILLGMNEIWGPAAVPTTEYTEHITGTHGSQTTCSIQGFIIQFNFVVPFYYIALSILGYKALLTRFRIEKYGWIEIYIHVGVYIFPLCSASYLLAVEAYNPAVRRCFVVNYPFGCVSESEASEDSTYPICTRGPENIDMIHMWLYSVPFCSVMTIPAFIMAALYCRIRRETNSKDIANSVAIQCAVYLLALYWSYIFRLIVSGSFMFNRKCNMNLIILAGFVESSRGVWIIMAYLYFRSDDPDKQNAGTRFLANIGLSRGSSWILRTSHHSSKKGSFQFDEKSYKDDGLNTETTRTARCSSIRPNYRASRDNINLDRYSASIHIEESGLNFRDSTHSNNSTRGRQSAVKPEFSIFDGFSVDSESPWAKFLREDVGEDAGYDEHYEYNDTSNFMLADNNDEVLEGSLLCRPKVPREEYAASAESIPESIEEIDISSIPAITIVSTTSIKNQIEDASDFDETKFPCDTEALTEISV